MKTSATLKKWNVDNKLDKDGNPDLRISVVVELPFQVHLATSLAQITTGDVLQFGLEKYQMEMDLERTEPDLSEVENEDEAQTQLLLTDGEYEEVGEGDGEQEEPPLTEAAG